MSNDIIIKTLEMTRRIRDANYEQISGKSPRERISFYRAKAQKLYGKIGIRPQKDSRKFPAS